MQTIIHEFCQAIDLANCKVIHGPQKISLFGGKTVNDDRTITSHRGVFLLHIGPLPYTFVVPEDYKNWNHFGTYSDLLTYEEDICSLVDCVVVFLETEGAIAELGCLIKHPEISPKLLVVIRDKFYKEDSFIKLGLLRYLENVHTENILVFHSEVLDKDEREQLLDTIDQRFKGMPKTLSFKKDNIRHILHLIIDFIELLQIARISDIHTLLEKLDIQLSKPRIEQLLLALKNIGLIGEDKVSKERCFFVPENNGPSIEYAFKGLPAKRLSWKAKAFTKTIEDNWRKYAFQKLKADKNDDGGEKNVA